MDEKTDEEVGARGGDAADEMDAVGAASVVADAVGATNASGVAHAVNAADIGDIANAASAVDADVGGRVGNAHFWRMTTSPGRCPGPEKYQKESRHNMQTPVET